ncbi:MAG: hypothetical protein J6V57_01155 [Spirochaetaceae bacterium]|nr:hypothetical protein [Spirochaetaceae bacterium]
MTARFRMEKKEKKIKTPHYRHPLFQLTNRALVFFSLFVVVSLLFYITGSINQFLDSSLLFILNILQVASIIVLVLCVFSFIQIIVFSLYYKDLSYLWHLFHIFFAVFMSIIGFVFSGVITVLSAGM